MRLSEMKRFRWNYPALAFLLPTSLMLIFMFITSCEPFGKGCMLYCDMYHQYYPFFVEFRQALRSGDSLLYNWSVGMGMDYLGLVSYYLASPLNLVTAVLPESWMLEYFSLLLPIKIGLASMFFAIMLKRVFQKNDPSIVVFGAFYGLCSWALGYNWNIMWLDSFALLPLVALGTVSLIKDRKFILYTVSLFFAITANYYIGLFVCIFTFFLFFAYELCRCKSILRFLEDLARIGFFTVLAIGLTAFLTLPTLASLRDTQSSVNTFPDGFSVNMVTGEKVTAAQEAWNAFQTAKAEGSGGLMGLFFSAIAASFPVLFDGMGQVAGNMGATITPTFIDGLPNLYCGVFAISFALLFLMSGKVNLRDKLCCLAFLLLFMASFIFRQLDYVWHGFHFTNQIPYRFSFLFSFVMLYMAYRAWLLRSEFRFWQILASGVLSVMLLFLSKQRQNDLVYVTFNLLLVAAYLIAMLYGSRCWCENNGFLRKILPAPKAETPEADEQDAQQTSLEPTEEAPVRETPAVPFSLRRQYASLAIVAVMFLELVLQVANFGTEFPVNEYNYPLNEEATASMIQVMKELEDDNELFYRTETTHAQILNDGALNHYYGLTTFTSSANVQVTNFAQALGFGAYKTWNRYLYEDSSPVTNLFTALKYLIERENPTSGNSCMKAIHSYQGVTLLENQYYLPLGFLANSELADLEFPNSTGGFSFQNRLFTAATGIEDKVWKNTPNANLTVEAQGDVTVNYTTSSSGYTNFSSGANGGQLVYTYSFTESSFFCLDVNLYSQTDFTVWRNGERLYYESLNLAQMFAVGDVVPGDQVQVMVQINANSNSSVSIRSATLDMEVFQQGYDILSASTLQLSAFSNTCFTGTIVCDRDGLLYTSVPQCGNKRDQEEGTVESEGNWSVYVDGKKVDITLVGDCMIGVPLTEGEHTIQFVYENPSFRLGWKVSLLCFGIFAGIITACYLPPYLKKKKAK